MRKTPILRWLWPFATPAATSFLPPATGVNTIPLAGWRSRGAHTYRSTGDIFDVPRSYQDIFKQQVENIEGNAPGCYNDLDMLIVGMHGKGNVGIGGCSDEQYLQHFAMWHSLPPR